MFLAVVVGLLDGDYITSLKLADFDLITVREVL